MERRMSRRAASGWRCKGMCRISDGTTDAAANAAADAGGGVGGADVASVR